MYIRGHSFFGFQHFYQQKFPRKVYVFVLTASYFYIGFWSKCISYVEILSKKAAYIKNSTVLNNANIVKSLLLNNFVMEKMFLNSILIEAWFILITHPDIFIWTLLIDFDIIVLLSLRSKVQSRIEIKIINYPGWNYITTGLWSGLEVPPS